MATALAGLAFLFAGCDNNSTTPTAPTGALQVTAARTVLRAGETLPLTVTGPAGAPVTGGAWTTSDASVLTVGATGVATATRAGRVTVTVTSGTASGSLALRVVPDYQGTWTGGLARPQITCSPASTAAFCAPGAPTTGTVTLRVTQVGDQLTGTLVDSAEPSATVPLTGSVLADDQLSLAGRLDTPATSPTTRIEVATLRATLDVVLGTLTGSYQWLVDRAPVGGTLQADSRAQAQFRDLRK
ncbi:hypothetical protein TBR22_A50740 [Luteitalea sp. TBR-22]|nr:hypothetical protein TBR22_A50740 [Luteitalea sp. TBR-22]